MKRILFICSLLTIVATGCKSSYTATILHDETAGINRIKEIVSKCP